MLGIGTSKKLYYETKHALKIFILLLKKNSVPPGVTLNTNLCINNLLTLIEQMQYIFAKM